MKTPLFWYEKTNLLATLLTPLGWIYGAGTKRRLQKSNLAFQAGVPVVCVGNINAGGTGKTPTTIALAQLLSQNGVNVHIASRGHRGRLKGPVLVQEQQHSAGDVGDEPLLMAAFAPTWVAKKRVEAVKAAVEAGAKLILMDDGFQDPSVHKDLSIVVVDAIKGFGNAKCIPAGPLREPVSMGLARADFLLSIGNDAAQQRFSLPDLGDTRWLKARLEPLPTGMDWQGMDALAFAGIGLPEKFFATLKTLGVNLLHAEALADHQPLSLALMKRLEYEAKLRGAQLVTTEKDAVRLPDAFRAKVLTLPVRLEFDDPSELKTSLQSLLTRSPV